MKNIGGLTSRHIVIENSSISNSCETIAAYSHLCCSSKSHSMSFIVGSDQSDLSALPGEARDWRKHLGLGFPRPFFIAVLQSVLFAQTRWRLAWSKFGPLRRNPPQLVTTSGNRKAAVIPYITWRRLLWWVVVDCLRGTHNPSVPGSSPGGPTN